MSTALEQDLEEARITLRPQGAWVIEEARELERVVRETAAGMNGRAGDGLVIDLSQVGEVDTAGAYLLVSLERAWRAAGGEVSWQSVGAGRAALIDRVRQTRGREGAPAPPRGPGLLDEIGAAVLGVGDDARRLVGLLGAVMVEMGRALVRPSLFRGRAVLRQMEYAGLRAVPIVALMSFIIGAIIAQQGAFQMRPFGAEIFSVDLVGILSLREVALLLTAIMVAGRSGSAITAELGSMKMREEIDALRVIGLDPVNVLVLPRVIALILVLPLLTFLAGMANLAGAMLTLWLYADIPPQIFVDRLREAIVFSTFWSGLIKAPFMALIIGMIACAEGMAVRGSAESLGRHTTSAVVKAIFMVIVVDGVFAMFYAAIDF